MVHFFENVPDWCSLKEKLSLVEQEQSNLGHIKLICSFSGTARPPQEPPHPSCYWQPWKKHFCRTHFAARLKKKTARIPIFSQDEKKNGRTPLFQLIIKGHKFIVYQISYSIFANDSPFRTAPEKCFVCCVRLQTTI